MSNEVLDTVLKAGEVLKIRGLWRQTDEGGAETTAEKQTNTTATTTQMATTSQNKAAPAKKQDADVQVRETANINTFVSTNLKMQTKSHGS